MVLTTLAVNSNILRMKIRNRSWEIKVVNLPAADTDALLTEAHTIGLGRIVVLYYYSSTPYQKREDVRCLYF